MVENSGSKSLTFVHGKDWKNEALTAFGIESDETLNRARRMDLDTLAQIHDRYYPEVYRYVRFRLDHDQTCEDITSEVFLRLLDALQKQRGPMKNLRGWLIGTASNLVNDHHRRNYSRPVDELPEEEEDHLASLQHPETDFETRTEQYQVRTALQKLTSEQQHILALRFTEERSIEETARLVGKSVNAVKALQFRALASLRRLLVDQRE